MYLLIPYVCVRVDFDHGSYDRPHQGAPCILEGHSSRGVQGREDTSTVGGGPQLALPRKYLNLYTHEYVYIYIHKRISISV